MYDKGKQDLSFLTVAFKQPFNEW